MSVFSRGAADSIRVTGQDHRCLALVCASDTLSYTMQPGEPYARLTAFFPDGCVIYTNPFACYDASLCESPVNNAPQKVDILLTVLYNLLVLAINIGLGFLLFRVFRKKRVNKYKRISWREYDRSSYL